MNLPLLVLGREENLAGFLNTTTPLLSCVEIKEKSYFSNLPVPQDSRTSDRDGDSLRYGPRRSARYQEGSSLDLSGEAFVHTDVDNDVVGYRRAEESRTVLVTV